MHLHLGEPGLCSLLAAELRGGGRAQPPLPQPLRGRGRGRDGRRHAQEAV